MSSSNNKESEKPSLLIVGAGGFIGGFIAAEGIRRGYDVYAAVRESTSRRYLKNLPVKYIVLDYDDPDDMTARLEQARPESGRWNAIIYNLGATKAARFSDFNRVNYTYLRDFVEAIHEIEAVPDKFLYMSSLSALGPKDEKNYTPYDGTEIPEPNTRYGLSKIKAETHLATQLWLPWIIFRPTGVYGPREKDYLMMVKSIDRHFDFGVGFRKQMLTFIYVEDLVGAMFDALASPSTVHRRYIISEPRSYTQKEFRRLVADALGRRFVLPVRVPIWGLWLVSNIAQLVGAITLRPSTLNADKFKIMRQRNWNCDVADAVRDFGFHADFPLERGVRETVDAYLREKNHHEQ